jgi:hypothetical protein
MKLKTCHFDTIEAGEAVSQEMLNTLTEHNFQDPFKKTGRSAVKGAYTRKGIISRVMVASRPKVSFDKMAAPVPEIMDMSLSSH